MSFAKRELEKMDEYRDLAFTVLREIGAIKTCDFHNDFYYSTYSFDEKIIYAMATAKAKELHESADIDFKLLHNKIKEIMDEAADSADKCPYCEKINRE